MERLGYISSYMAGSVFKVLVKPGDIVEPGNEVVILESMKMEIPICESKRRRIC